MHNDPDYLAKQYRTASNLNTRIDLHQRYSTNPYGWFRWVFDQLDFPPDARVLEIGCGPCRLWAESRERIPAGWRLTLSDASAGMLDQARQALGELTQVTFQPVDAEQTPLPFADATFDAVIANHMLYHIHRRAELIKDVRRVLKPGGVLIATTNGERSLAEIGALLKRFKPDYADWMRPSAPFTLENGSAQLSAAFPRVELRRYPDSLAITDPEPLVDYILSGWAETIRGHVPELRAAIQQEMKDHGGVFSITKDPGLFIARVE